MQKSSFDRERILAETFVGSIHFLPEMRSTNDEALELVRAKSIKTPCLVLTERQTAGRGRGTNRWWSAEGALTFSLVMEADEQKLPAPRWPQISLYAGLAICEALQQIAPGLPVGLKWPNDVFIIDKKVCGVLVEVPSSKAGHVVVGIGLNVNNSFESAPADVRGIATSLLDEKQHRFSMSDVLVCLLQAFQQQWLRWEQNGEHLSQQWPKHCLLSGRHVCLETAGRSIEGRCLGINADGALRIDTGEAIECHVVGHVKSFD